MGKKKIYTKEEIQYISDNYGKMSVDMIAFKLKRTTKQIYDYVSYMRSEGYNIPYLPKRKNY